MKFVLLKLLMNLKYEKMWSGQLKHLIQIQIIWESLF